MEGYRQKAEPVGGPSALKWIDWASGGAATPPEKLPVEWLLAHSFDGVTWGYREGTGWELSSTHFNEVSPPVSARDLLELRLFGPEGELHLWRLADGFGGRILRDGKELNSSDPLAPELENRVILASEFIETRGGFTLVSDGTGSRHALPLACEPEWFRNNSGDVGGYRWPIRLQIKNYFEEDDKTGSVRVSASRLVDLHGGHML